MSRSNHLSVRYYRQSIACLELPLGPSNLGQVNLGRQRSVGVHYVPWEYMYLIILLLTSSMVCVHIGLDHTVIVHGVIGLSLVSREAMGRSM